MTTTGLRVFDHTIQETNIWLKELMGDLGPDRQRAYDALRATLQTLRDRLTVEEATDLGAQLPMLVRGIYYEGWNPAKTPEKLRTREDFLARLNEHIQEMRPMNAEQVARAVFGVLDRHITAGQAAHVQGLLPRDVRSLWPSADVS